MFGKISKIFSRNTKTKRKGTHTKKVSYYFDDQKTSFFKRRKNHALSFELTSHFKLLIITGIGGVCLCGILFLIFSPFFRVDSVYIFRQDSIINIDQAYGNIDYIRGKNILFLNTNEIAQRLQKAQKSISNIEFDIDFPNTVNIQIGAYTPIFQTDTYLILSNGVVVTKDLKDYIGVPKLETSENIDDYAIFGNTLNVQNLKQIDTLIKEIKRNILGFNYDQVKYYITEKELLLQHTSGSIFIFDLNNDILSQIKKLAVYEKEEGNIYEKKYIYVDARVPEKIFLCPIQAEYDCRKSLESIYGDPIFEVSFEPLQ